METKGNTIDEKVEEFVNRLKAENPIETVDDYIKVAGKIREMIKGFCVGRHVKWWSCADIELLPENPYWVKSFSEQFNQEEWFKKMKIDRLWETLGLAYEDHLAICDRREKILKKIAEKTSGRTMRDLRQPPALVRPNRQRSMDDKEIVETIGKVLAATETVVAQLKKEKKETGDYSKSVALQDGDLQMRFDALEYRGKYPPISVNLLFYVVVFRNNVPVMKCMVANIKHQYEFHFGFLYGHYNCSDKYKMCALVCDHSHVKPLFRSGDTLCIDNNPGGLRRLSGKAAFVKVEILSETLDESLSKTSLDCLRRIRLTKELGHKETLAYAKWDEMETYVADDSTQEFFRGKDTLEVDLPTYYKTEEIQYEGFSWEEYTEEVVSYDSKLKFTTPATEEEIRQQLVQKALDRLLDDCRGEFCYGDHRVETYKDKYMILGEEVIKEIHDDYLEWLDAFCDTFAQDAASGEFTGIAVDWQGMEDQVPDFSQYLKGSTLF